MMDHYILEGKTPVKADWDTYVKWLTKGDNGKMGLRRVGWSGEDDGLHVSTVFLGLDHSYGPNEPPMLFETMIFGGEHDQWQERCSTWEQAEAQHREACKLAGIVSSV